MNNLRAVGVLGSNMGPFPLFLAVASCWHASRIMLAWYVEHAVGRGHGGENIAAAVVVFLP